MRDLKRLAFEILASFSPAFTLFFVLCPNLFCNYLAVRKVVQINVPLEMGFCWKNGFLDLVEGLREGRILRCVFFLTNTITMP